MAVGAINNVGKAIKGAKILVMGCTYKENATDTREAPVRDMIRELCERGAEVYGYDPLVRNGEKDFGIKFLTLLTEAPRMDCVILTVAHDIFKAMSFSEIRDVLDSRPVIIDIPGSFGTEETRVAGIVYERL